MIKPDTIDGVPEEEGFYYVHYTDNAYDFWIVGPIEPFGDSGLWFFYHNGGLNIEIPEKDFDDYIWSERIAEPDET